MKLHTRRARDRQGLIHIRYQEGVACDLFSLTWTGFLTYVPFDTLPTCLWCVTAKESTLQ